MWTYKDISKLYKLEISKTSFYRDESNKVLPAAKKIRRGKLDVRYWDTCDLPKIGEKYGFLKKNKSLKIISLYTPKGGVLKTTLAFNIARILALNGIKTLVVGLDIQCSVTNNLLRTDNKDITSISQIKKMPDLFSLLGKDLNENEINKIVLKTDLPTLDFIPESSNLAALEQKIRDLRLREYTIQKLLSPISHNYDVIIFDNSPNWNFLIQNSLTCATDIISPIGCDIETFRSVSENIEMINDYKSDMSLKWNSFTLVPTKLERSKISREIESQYRRLFPNIISPYRIRSASVGQESSMDKISVIEYSPDSNLAGDYYDLIQDLWNRINNF